jgi:hypothetical protein
MIMQKTDFDSIATDHEEAIRKPPFCPLPLTLCLDGALIIGLTSTMDLAPGLATLRH